MNSNAIESIAVDYLSLQIARCELLRSEIPKKDKTPSFDGHIELYSKPDNKKSDLLGRCPVQVKGKIFQDEDFFKEKISYPADVDDLKNYLKDGGVIYFVVGINETHTQYKIYYCSLLPIDIKNLLNQLKKTEQKGKSIHLDNFPQSSEQIEDIFQHFVFHRKKQFSFIGKNFREYMRLWQANDSETGTIWINPTPTLLDALLDGKPKYFYRKFADKISIPYHVGTITELAIENAKVDVSIDGKIFFKNVTVCFKKAVKIKSVTLNQGLSIQVNSNDKNANIKFTEKCTIPHYIENLKFMIALVKGKELKIGNLAVGSNPKIDDDINLLEQRLEFFKKVQTLLERLHIAKKIKVREITDSMYRSFGILYQIIFENRLFEEKIAGPGFCIMTIGAIRCLLFRSERSATIVKYVNPFEKNERKFSISRSDSDIQFPASLFVSLNKKDILSCDNIIYPRITEDVTAVKYSKVYGEALNNFVLELLSAYDASKNEEILDCVIKIISWLYKQEQNEIHFINKFQAILRHRPFNQEELNQILEMRENSNELELRLGYSILLGEKYQYRHLLEKLSPKRREEFLKYPIANLIIKDIYTKF